MTFKHILVHIDDSRHLDSRLKVALQLAADHEAQVTGLYVIAPPFVPTYMSGVPSENLDSAVEACTRTPGAKSSPKAQ